MENPGNIFKTPLFFLLFCLFFLMMNWPVITIADREGGATLYFYLYFLWGVIIFTFFLISRFLENESPKDITDEQE